MNFNSVEYICFLLIVCAGYFIMPRRVKNPLLLVSSYFFYACWNARYALLMALVTLTAFIGAVLIEKERKKILLLISLTICLLLLLFFKYAGFIVQLFNTGFSAFNIDVYMTPLDILLPVGISFYTMQAMGYMIDVYRGKIAAERGFINFALFIAFFPQLVAGPIERASNILSQLETDKKFDFGRMREGMLMIGGGLFKKMVIADRLAAMVNPVYNDVTSYSGYSLFIATVAFAFQIYCDFSAYSDIARGSAHIIGINLMRNFRSPYFSSGIREFWRNWHISLSEWFKDYVYFPLGGNRRGFWRTQLNLMIVFLISGLWHGAALRFIVWGFIHGFYQIAGNCIHKLTGGKTLPKIVAVPFTFALCCFAWVFFRADSIPDALYIVSHLLNINQSFISAVSAVAPPRELAVAVIALTLMLVMELAARRKEPIAFLTRLALPLRQLVYIALIIGILVFGVYGGTYMPQNFLYFQF